MKLLLVLSVLAVAGSALAQPSDILIYYDNELGYGDAVVTAANNLWPTANIAAYSGGQTGQESFNADMAAQSWDIIVAECWYNDTDYLYWGGINDLYDTGASAIYASCWEWTGGTSGQMALATAMGVSAVSGFGSPVIPHYAWEPAHPICDGISDWSWADPGLGILNARMTVSDATPVTGWTASATAGEAGICVANDGISVISGYTPAYATEGVAIWENILEFMAGGSALQPATWGEIKASF